VIDHHVVGRPTEYCSAHVESNDTSTHLADSPAGWCGGYTRSITRLAVTCFPDLEYAFSGVAAIKLPAVDGGTAARLATDLAADSLMNRGFDFALLEIRPALRRTSRTRLPRGRRFRTWSLLFDGAFGVGRSSTGARAD